MRQECKCDGLPNSKRYVTMLMKVKEDIVYDKHTGNVVGFCNLETLNDELLRIERDANAHPLIASHILVIIIHSLS